MAHIILQAPRIASADIERLAAIAAAGGVQELGPAAVRLLNVDPDCRLELLAQAHAARLDAAWLDSVQPLAQCRLLAMDMDSTLINIECIDEIAAASGRGAEVAAITAAAMRGEITDFAESLRLRVGLLRGVPASVLEDVFNTRLRLNPGAERLIEGARAHGLQIMLISGGFDFFTERLRRGLALDHAYGNTLEIDRGLLTGKVQGDIIDAAAKARLVRAHAAQLGADASQIIVMGDGANDLAMMETAHYSVAYRAKPLVRAQARFTLDFSPLDAVLNWFRLRSAVAA